VADAWRRFTDRLAALGELIEGDGYPDDPLGRAEGQRYLARLTALALQQATDFDDPSFPVLYRLNDDVTKWAGPNVDNVYLAAAVGAPHRYRLTGNIARSRGFILQTLHGWWGQDDFRVCDDRSSADFDVAPDGSVEVLLGGPEVDGNWMPLAEDADRLFVREYLTDWHDDRRGDLLLERLDLDPVVPAVLDGDAVAVMLDRAASWLELNVPFWRDLEAGMRGFLEPNTFGAPYRTPLGGSDIWYGNGRVVLEPHQALVVEVAEPVARYWSMQLYSPGWYESLDFRNRQTSLNAAQAHVDADGLVRYVLAEHDPGTPNWLDLAGHREVLVHYRAIWCAEAPRAMPRLVAAADVRAGLPADHPVVTPEQRRLSLDRRRADVLARLRR